MAWTKDNGRYARLAGEEALTQAKRAETGADYIDAKQPLIDEFTDEQTNLQTQLNDLTGGLTVDSEVIQARGGSPVLNDRLDGLTSQLAETVTDIEQRGINFKSLGVLGNGTDETQKIQDILNVRSGNLIFTDGTYKITQGLKVKLSDTHLFATPKARFEYVSESTEPFLEFGGSESTVTYSVSQNLTKGSSVIYLSAIPSDLNTGDWIKLSSNQLYHSSRPEYTNREFHRIVSVDTINNTITLDSFLIFDYDIATYPTTIVRQNFLKNVSVTGVKVSHIGTANTTGIQLYKCYNGLVTACEVNEFKREGVSVKESVGTSVINNYAEVNAGDTGLSYGIFVNSCYNTLVSQNKVYSARTAIDISFLSYKTIVSNNLLLQGNLNTHACVDINIANNTLSNGFINIRGHKARVINNSIKTNFTVGILLGEVAEYGDILIDGNYIEGTETVTTKGIQAELPIKNVTVTNNTIRNCINGISFYLGQDVYISENLIVSKNNIKVNGGFGIDVSRGQNITISDNIIIGKDTLTAEAIKTYTGGATRENIIVTGNHIRLFKRSVLLWSTYNSCVVCNNVIKDHGNSIGLDVLSTKTVIANNITKDTV